VQLVGRESCKSGFASSLINSFCANYYIKPVRYSEVTDHHMTSSNVEYEIQSIVDAAILREIVKPPNTLTSDGNAVFRWTEEFLYIGTIDGASVMSVEQKVTPAAFFEYSIGGFDEISFGVPCNKLETLLEEASENEKVRAKYSKETNKFEITFPGVDYSFSARNPDSIREPPNRETPFQNEVKVTREVFTKARNIFSMVDNQIIFEMGNGEARLRAEGDDDQAIIDLSISDSDLDENTAEITFVEDNGKVTAIFSLDYISHIPKFIPASGCKVKIDGEYPMKINANRAENRIPTEIVIGQRLSSNS
jgi:hypothetical protein